MKLFNSVLRERDETRKDILYTNTKMNLSSTSKIVSHIQIASYNIILYLLFFRFFIAKQARTLEVN